MVFFTHFPFLPQVTVLENLSLEKTLEMTQACLPRVCGCGGGDPQPSAGLPGACAWERSWVSKGRGRISFILDPGT